MNIFRFCVSELRSPRTDLWISSRDFRRLLTVRLDLIIDFLNDISSGAVVVRRRKIMETWKFKRVLTESTNFHGLRKLPEKMESRVFWQQLLRYKYANAKLLGLR